MEEFFKEFIAKFMRDNAEDMAELPVDLVNMGLSAGIAEAIPDHYVNPRLNNMRMKYASEGLKYAADQKERMDRIKAKLKEQILSAVFSALSKIAAGALA